MNIRVLEDKLGDLDKHKDTLLIENNANTDDNQDQDIVKVGEDISDIRMPENKEDMYIEMNKQLENQQERINELTLSYNNEKHHLANHFEREKQRYEEKINTMRSQIQEVRNKLENELAKRNDILASNAKQIEE
jgi:hypothetical protein